MAAEKPIPVARLLQFDVSSVTGGLWGLAGTGCFSRRLIFQNHVSFLA
jgi:hypothetical protein